MVLPVFACFPRYASLYFCCAIEDQDNELLTLEVVHRYVELLDRYFGNVGFTFSHELIPVCLINKIMWSLFALCSICCTCPAGALNPE